MQILYEFCNVPNGTTPLASHSAPSAYLTRDRLNIPGRLSSCSTTPRRRLRCSAHPRVTLWPRLSRCATAALSWRRSAARSAAPCPSRPAPRRRDPKTALRVDLPSWLSGTPAAGARFAFGASCPVHSPGLQHGFQLTASCRDPQGRPRLRGGRSRPGRKGHPGSSPSLSTSISWRHESVCRRVGSRGRSAALGEA